jgi:hypothetical protein
MASAAGNAASLVFFLFDLLYLDGEDLAARPFDHFDRAQGMTHRLAVAGGITAALQRLPDRTGPGLLREGLRPGSKASSRNAPMPRTHPVIAVSGSRSNA